jgi:hypothetical protein
MPSDESPGPSPAEGALTSGWEAVDRAWDDLEAHRRLLVLANELDALPDLARRYRAAASDEARAPIAKAQADRIVTLALHKIATTKVEQSDLPRRVVLALRATAFCFLLIVCIFAASVLFDCGSTGVRATLVHEEPESAHAAGLQSP